jgi:hypothetical protein
MLKKYRQIKLLKDGVISSKRAISQEITNASADSESTSQTVQRTIEGVFNRICNGSRNVIYNENEFIKAVDNAYYMLPFPIKIALRKKRFHNILLNLRIKYIQRNQDEESIIAQEYYIFNNDTVALRKRIINQQNKKGAFVCGSLVAIFGVITGKSLDNAVVMGVFLGIVAVLILAITNRPSQITITYDDADRFIEWFINRLSLKKYFLTYHGKYLFIFETQKKNDAMLGDIKIFIDNGNANIIGISRIINKLKSWSKVN